MVGALSDSVRSYLDHLGVEPAPPSLEGLRDIVRRHMLRIPFENLNFLIGLREAMTIKRWTFERYVAGLHRGRGGTCPTLTPFFAEMLSALGYDSNLHLADFWSIHQKAPGPPNEHCVIRVRVDGCDYMIDPCIRAPFLDPIPYDKTEPYRMRVSVHDFVVYPRKPDGSLDVEVFRKGVSTLGYKVHPEVQTRQFFWDTVVDCGLDLENPFITNIEIVKCIGGTDVLHLRNNRLFATRNQKLEVTEYKSVDELERGVHEDMALPGLDVRGAVETLHDIAKVDLF